MLSVEGVQELTTEAIRNFKGQLDSERDSYQLQNADLIRQELNSLLERTQASVEQVAANHQAQLDHVTRVSVA